MEKLKGGYNLKSPPVVCRVHVSPHAHILAAMWVTDVVFLRIQVEDPLKIRVFNHAEYFAHRRTVTNGVRSIFLESTLDERDFDLCLPKLTEHPLDMWYLQSGGEWNPPGNHPRPLLHPAQEMCACRAQSSSGGACHSYAGTSAVC